MKADKTTIKNAHALLSNLSREAIGRYLAVINFNYCNQVSYGRKANRDTAYIRAVVYALNLPE